MSKAAATKQARAILSSGHFAIAGTADAYVMADGRKLRLYGTAGRLSHGEMVKQLAAALLDIATYGDCSCEMS